MHAVIIDVTVPDWAAAKDELDEMVMPLVSSIPGFVAAYWIALSGENGTSLLLFESESSAQALAAQAQSAPVGSVTTQRVAVGEVVAHS